ncbi:hypothetical protein ASG01_10555 [Chryseobacterium sp. Leaf180]|uniref:head GIN domain-containing protein n=1 Tax=Chryseobacterium sp. Leaf180 TaxID=1736289 RepID=UPI0006FEED6E|nr:head GIN domain-containing protein [Chryseobacterium sp. Leaf180]KQR93600.1 hypothetical protein ASG01_10555 [Chryseobacterium sp. Leaf180]
MKRHSLFLFSAVLFLSSCKDNAEKPQWLPDVTTKDLGSMKEREFPGNFDEIEVSQSIEAEIIKSDTEKVVITAPSDLIDEILVEMEGDKVYIHYKRGIRIMNNAKVKAMIYAKDFDKIKANSAASITLKDKFTQDKTDIDLSSGSSFSGDIEANDMEIDLSSSSSFEGKIWSNDLKIDASSGSSLDIKGKSKKADILLSSGSSLSGKDVTVRELKADASSGSSLEITVTEKLNATSSSGASINAYRSGNSVAVQKQESSGGSVSVE